MKHKYFDRQNSYKDDDDKLDHMFTFFDLCFFVDDFDTPDDIISKYDIENTKTELLIGVLTISFVFRKKLKSRPDFYEKVKNQIGEHLVTGLA